MAPHSSTLAWQISWMEEPGRLQSMGSLRVGHDWAPSLSLFTFMHWRRKWQPTPVSCLENPRDGGAWWAAVYGVAQSRTRLSDSAGRCLVSLPLVNQPSPHSLFCPIQVTLRGPVTSISAWRTWGGWGKGRERVAQRSRPNQSEHTMLLDRSDSLKAKEDTTRVSMKVEEVKVQKVL